MSIQEQKITEAAIAANGVQSRPDKLTGTAAQNKKVFDALVTAVVREKFNARHDCRGAARHYDDPRLFGGQCPDGA